MENLDLGESSGMAFNGKIDNISKEDFITQSGGVANNHEDMWKSWCVVLTTSWEPQEEGMMSTTLSFLSASDKGIDNRAR
jgi:hypothetical protein